MPWFASNGGRKKLQLESDSCVLFYVSKILDTAGSGRRTFVRAKPLSFNSTTAVSLETLSVDELPVSLVLRVVELFADDSDRQIYGGHYWRSPALAG